jgi:hypothetical protein
MKAPQEDRPFKDSTAAQVLQGNTLPLCMFLTLLQGFHNDIFCDILAMQSRGQAAEGGRHFISSALKVYNELALERPDLLEVLATPNWTFDK